jgi:hypothetical protein
MKISKVLDKFKNTTTLEKLNNFILPNIKNIKNLNILEFGVDKGISTAFFLNLINSNKGKLTSVDIKNYKDLYLHKNWTFIHSKDDNYKNIERFIKKKFDIIFLDTEHTAQHIKKIFYYYYPKLKLNGLFIIDDIFWIPYCKGNYRDNFWIEINNKESFKMLLDIYNSNQDRFDLDFSSKHSGLAKIKKLKMSRLNKIIKLKDREFSIKNFLSKLKKLF